MAINPSLISASGFNGVSCQTNASVGKASLSYNVDTSKGTIRPRDGFVTIRRFYPVVESGSPTKAIAVRVLGIESFITNSGVSLILSILWDENTNSLLMAVIDQTGNLIDSSMPINISQFPYSAKPGPYMFPVFQKFGNKIYMSFPSGQIFYYCYDENPLKIFTPNLDGVGFRTSALSYLDELPTASLITLFQGSMVYAGLPGNAPTSFSFDVPEIQDDIPEDQVDFGRGSLNFPKGTILFSDPHMPEAIKGLSVSLTGVGDDITAIHGVGNVLYAFTSSKVLAGAFNPSMGFVPHFNQIAGGVGCVSQRTIVEGNGITTFLSHGGVYAINGQSIVKISSDIDDMFSEEGWDVAPIYNMAQTRMSNLGQASDQSIKYPFKILNSQLKFACGGYDEVRNLMWWSVPVAGTHDDNEYTNQHQNGSLDEMIAKVCIVYDPTRQSWNIWGPSHDSSFIPTCFANTLDNGRPRFLFGDEFSGVNAYGEDTVDKKSTTPGTHINLLTKYNVSFAWFWQSQPMEIGPATVAAARSIRIKQQARGGNLALNPQTTLTSWFLESEFSFDEPNGELSFTNTISPNPSELYPKQKTPDHIWGTSQTIDPFSAGSTWGSVRWHRPSTWKAKYSVNNNIVGRSFKVGFAGFSYADRDLKERIYDFDLELQPKRDVT